MRKIIGLTLAFAFSIGAYPQIEEGRFVIETNTAITALGQSIGNGTGIWLASSDGETVWNFGFEGGYFVERILPLNWELDMGIMNFLEKSRAIR